MPTWNGGDCLDGQVENQPLGRVVLTPVLRKRSDDAATMTRPKSQPRRRPLGAAAGAVGWILAAWSLATEAPAQPLCAGDCDADGATSVAEVVVGVRVALGLTALDLCPTIDWNCDAQASIGELIASVRGALTGCRPGSILVVGDSITYGVDGAPVDGALSIDPQGGFAGRLGVRLNGRARVVGRGIPGAGPRVWLNRDFSEPTFFSRFLTERWPEIDPPRRGTASLLETVVAAERADVVLILLGVNELLEVAGVPASPADEIVDRLADLAKEADRLGAHALVCTVLANARDDPAEIARLNAGIRDTFGAAAILLGEEFAAVGGEDLLGDTIHPSMAGHEALAVLLEQELEDRGIVPIDRAAAGCRERDGRGGSSLRTGSR